MFRDVRARCEEEPELQQNGSGYVLYALMDAVVDRYFPVIEAIETELEEIEEHIFANRSPRANIEALYGLKQKLTKIRHAVAPLLESVENLSGARVPSVCTGMTEYFRHRRPPTAAESNDRIDLRNDIDGIDGHFSELVDDHTSRERDNEAPRRLCSARCDTDDDRRQSKA